MTCDHVILAVHLVFFFAFGFIATLFNSCSGDLMTCYWRTNQKVSYESFGAIRMWMLLCCIDYDKIHSFSLVNLLLEKVMTRIYLDKSWMQLTWILQMESEMRGLSLLIDPNITLILISSSSLIPPQRKNNLSLYPLNTGQPQRKEKKQIIFLKLTK